MAYKEALIRENLEEGTKAIVKVDELQKAGVNMPEAPISGIVESMSIEEANNMVKETQEQSDKSIYETFFGVIMMLIGVVLFAFSTVFCKFAYMSNEALTGFDYLIVRSSTLVIASLIQACSLRVNLLDVKKEGRFWLFVRCFLGAIFFPCFYVSLKFLPSSKATLISTLHPLLVTIAGYYFLKESLSKFDIIAVAGAFIGVLVMNIHTTDSSKIDAPSEMVAIGVAL